MPSNFFQSIKDFFASVWSVISDGLLLFGGPVDTFMSIVDILATTFVIYYILKLLRDTRAWQLLKGLLLIFAFGVFSSMIGLDTIGFLLNRTISLFAIAFVVIFQPELRRALETFGRSSFNVIASTFSVEGRPDMIHQLIESIVNACEIMSLNRTGALLIMERATKLGELEKQENAIPLDAEVTSSLLQQIFYSGSPLHDGAVLIRHGRIAAARVHVPLSDNYNLRREFGTRHRAAVGASEMGDAISVVVSEERGSISIAVGGKLYVLSNADALRTQLHRLLSVEAQEKRTGLGRLLSGRQDRTKRQKSTNTDGWQKNDGGNSEIENVSALQEEQKATERFRVNKSEPNMLLKNKGKGLPAKKKPIGGVRRQRAALFAISLLIAFGIWIYVQITINPITTRNYNVQLQYRNEEIATENGFGVQSFPIESVQLRLKGRERLLQDLSANDIVAFVDLGEVIEQGIQSLPVQIDTGTVFYTYTELLLPARVSINIYSIDSR